MSNSDDKKDSKTSASESPVTKPVKRSRKRQASRPPTINVKAVHLEAETTETGEKAASENIKEDVSGTQKKATAETGKDNRDTKAGDEKSETAKSAQSSGQFGYRALALAAGVGAAASIVLFAGVFGVKVFTSGQKGLEDKIANLSGEVETLRSIANTSQDSLNNNKAIKVLNQQIKKLSNRPQDTRFQKLNAQIKSLEEDIAKSQKPSIEAAELKNLLEKLNALEVKTEEAKLSAEKSIRRTTNLEEAVKAADEAIKGTTDGAQGSIVAQNLRLAGLDQQIKDLSDSLDSLQLEVSENTKASKIEEIVSNLREGVSSLEGRVQALDGLITTANKQMKTSRETLLKIDKRLLTIEQEDRSSDINHLAALSFAIEGLARKIETGGAFERELKVVNAAIPNNKKLDNLTQYAKTGIKTIAQVQNDFKPVLRDLLSVGDAQSTPGMVQKLVGSARSLIRIRRVGEVEGDSREALIARLEARVKAGDLPAALVAAKKLEGAAAKAAEVWVGEVEKRLMTIELIKSIRNDVISSLGSK